LVESKGCTLACDDASPLAASPTPLPAVVRSASPEFLVALPPDVNDSCSKAQTDLLSCFDANLSQEDLSECDSCVATAIATISKHTVGDIFRGDVCAAIDKCPTCGACATRVELILSCASRFNRIGFPVALEAFCDTAQEDLVTCLGTLPNGGACDSCVAISIPPQAASCAKLESVVCSAIPRALVIAVQTWLLRI
jgi:hypothetical protein